MDTRPFTQEETFSQLHDVIFNNERLFCPVMLSHVLQSLGNYTPRAIFPGNVQNQSIKRRLSLWTFRSIDWLIDDKLTLTWLVYWNRTARSVFTGAGLKWLNTTGWYRSSKSKTAGFFSNFPFLTCLSCVSYSALSFLFNFQVAGWDAVSFRCGKCLESAGKTALLDSLLDGIPHTTVLSRGVQSLFGPTRKSSPWGNLSDGGSNQSIKRRLSL